MSTTKTLIVFDCDGTLVDSQHLIAESMRLAFVGEGLVAPERAVILRTVGLSIPETLTLLAPDQSPALRNKLASSYRDWCLSLRQRPQRQEPMFEGAVPLLTDLAARENVLIGLATGKSRRGVARFIEQNELHGVFSTIQTADDAPSKPHPAMLLRAMEETGADPQNTVMVGDTSYDMVMAGCANVTGIGVTWGYQSTADLLNAGAQTIVHSFSGLAQTLDSMYFGGRLEAVA